MLWREGLHPTRGFGGRAPINTVMNTTETNALIPAVHALLEKKGLGHLKVTAATLLPEGWIRIEAPTSCGDVFVGPILDAIKALNDTRESDLRELFKLSSYPPLHAEEWPAELTETVKVTVYILRTNGGRRFAVHPEDNTSCFFSTPAEAVSRAYGTMN